MSLVLQVIRHSLGITGWGRKVRKTGYQNQEMLSIHGLHHPRADTVRLYVHRQEERTDRISLSGSNYETREIYER